MRHKPTRDEVYEPERGHWQIVAKTAFDGDTILEALDLEWLMCRSRHYGGFYAYNPATRRRTAVYADRIGVHRALARNDAQHTV